jgi:nicotinamide riboside kinase
MLKILVTGVYSCGKTTLVEELAKRISATDEPGVVSVRRDPGRECPLPLNQEQTLHSSFWMAAQVIQRESELLAASPAYLICDRGIPDIVSHSYDLEEVQAGLLGLSDLEDLMKKWMQSYDLVFRATFDARISVATDNLRVADDDYRRRLDGQLSRALRASNIEYVTLSNDLDGRIEEIVSAIRSFRSDG